jgi:hypothetical protein
MIGKKVSKLFYLKGRIYIEDPSIANQNGVLILNYKNLKMIGRI